ncbi:MAG: M48 family metallopeptidase [Acidobacteriaceae bacterium]
MRPGTCFGLASLLAAALLAAASGASAQQPSDSTTAPAATAPAGAQPTAAQPAAACSDRPAFGVPNDTCAKTGSNPGSKSDSSAQPAADQPAANSSDQPSFGVPNDTSAKTDSTTGSNSGTAAQPGTGTDSSKPPAAKSSATAETDAIPSPGEALDPHIKKGSEDDVDAVGTRNIGGRGLGNWHSTNWEISAGKQYSMEIEKSAHLVTDPVVTEYVNRIGQNIVKNSDCKVPFTIKVIDSDEINAMALPGGFFYVNSGLIMAADEEAELAGVMAHETAHVCAHHAAREMTRANYAEIGEIPLIIFTQGSWTGYGIYEASQLAIPVSFLEFSREFEAEADWLGVQYMYKAGYDPQAFIQFFEKLDALEKHKPGSLAKVFADHPQTPDRIAHSEEEIATILPARPDYVVTTSEFDDVKARLARIENRRKLNDKGNSNGPTLRRVGGTNNDPNSTSGTSTTDDRPTLGRRD